MALVTSYSKSGSKTPTITELESQIFAIRNINNDLLRQAYIAHQANQRENLAHTKIRSKVRGGGRKPWRQKGTGRARHGSIRSPLWRGGGITFGPTNNTNYKKKISKKVKLEAIKQALTTAANRRAIKVIEEFRPKDNKTKEADLILNKIGATRNVLLVVANKTEDILKSTRNLNYLTVKSANYLNVFEIMNADYIVIEEAGLEIIKNWLIGGNDD